MIAILTTEKEALELSANIHNYLKANREDYKAIKWSELNKSDSEEKWAVKIPNDYKYEGKVVNSLPDNWVINNDI